MIKTWFLLIAFWGSVLFCSSQVLESQKGQEGIAKIDSIIHHYMTEDKLVGVSVGIVRNGAVYLAKGYGVQQIETARPVDKLTNFLTCSVSKLFTATAIMQLAEQGKIDIRKKLTFYLPDFKMKDERYKEITIEHLLTHTSGLPWDKKLSNSPDDSTALKKLVYSFENTKLAFAPGTRFNPVETYSNAAYDILGYLVQVISHQPYPDYIRHNILEKTGMVFSSFDADSIPDVRKCVPHILQKKNVKPGGIISEGFEHTPSANLNSCALDMCQFITHVLKMAVDTGSAGILHYQTLQNMWAPRHTAPQNKTVSIGLGWWITDSESLGKYYWHVGDNPGWSATLLIFPAQNTGIVVLNNGMYSEQTVWNKIPFAILSVLNED